MPEPSQELLDGSTASLDDAGNEAAGVSDQFSQGDVLAPQANCSRFRLSSTTPKRPRPLSR